MKSILNVLLFSFLFVSIFSTAVLAAYRMELWVKKPDTTTTKVNECSSTVANFQCLYNYYDCSQVGTYQGNAITYQDTTFLSQSGWKNLYTCYLPKGWLDAVDCNSFRGWTCDPDNYAAAIDVHFYKDGPAGTGTFIGSTTANQPREQAVGAECGGYTNHGFVFNTPASVKDGLSHTIYAYAINIPSGPNPQLSGSPKTLAPCTTTTTSSSTTTTTIPNPPSFTGGTFNITGYIEYLNVFWEATYTNHNQVAVNCTFYGKIAQLCTPNPYIQPPGKGSCTVANPAYDYTKPNTIICRVYDPANPSLYSEY